MSSHNGHSAVNSLTPATKVARHAACAQRDDTKKYDARLQAAMPAPARSAACRAALESLCFSPSSERPVCFRGRLMRRTAARDRSDQISLCVSIMCSLTCGTSQHRMPSTSKLMAGKWLCAPDESQAGNHARIPLQTIKLWHMSSISSHVAPYRFS